MHVLVTGGLGFVGGHLVEELKNHTVDIVDSGINKRIDPKELPMNELFMTDVRDFKPKYQYDEIYHLGSPVGPAGVLRFAGEIAPDIINGLRNILEMAHKQNATIMYVSSSEIYGPHVTDEPQIEHSDKIVPNKITVRLEYGVSKLLGEIMAFNHARDKSYDLKIVRFFNTIGERQSPEYGFVVPRFFGQALTGNPITVFGTGEQKRFFTYVKDSVDAMRFIMKRGSRCDPYNIGNQNNGIVIKELAQKIKNLTDSCSEIIFVDPKTIYGPTFEEAWNKNADITKLMNLGWKPKWSLDNTLEKLNEYYNERLQTRKVEV